MGRKTHCLTSSSISTGLGEWLPKVIFDPDEVDLDVRVCSHVRIASMNSEGWLSTGKDPVSGVIGDSCE